MNRMNLKIVMDQMLYEERDKIRIRYHSWVIKPIVEKNQVKGVIFESKEGRKAIMAKIVIDATGDGIFKPVRGPLFQSC